MALLADTDDRQAVTRAVTGGLFSGTDGQAVTLFCAVLQEEEMVVLNTSKGGEAAFASSMEKLSRIYDMAVPGTMLTGMVQCRILIREGGKEAAAGEAIEKT